MGSMKLSTFAKTFLASALALNGISLTASVPTPKAEQPVLTEWANALGLAGGQAVNDDITAVDYWATGSVLLNGAPCALTSYHVSTNYKAASVRQEFSCVDATGKAHHEINESASQLWSDPLALVKAATTGGTATKISIELGQTVVTFPAPGIGGATVKATLNDKHQASQA